MDIEEIEVRFPGNRGLAGSWISVKPYTPGHQVQKWRWQDQSIIFPHISNTTVRARAYDFPPPPSKSMNKFLSSECAHSETCLELPEDHVHEVQGRGRLAPEVALLGPRG